MGKEILVALTDGGEYIGYDVPPKHVDAVERWLYSLSCINSVWYEDVNKFHQRFPKPEDL